MGIEVKHSERDIQTAEVVIRAMVDRRAIGVPLLAAISPEHGYRLAAERYLDMVMERRQKGLPLRRPGTMSLSKDEGDWQELNERWDWEEKKENGGRKDRELPA